MLRTVQEGSEENENMLLENRGKGIFFIVAENLAGLCHAIMWKAELISNEYEYLAEKISKQNVKGTDWLFSFSLQQNVRKKR